ncbi:MAG: hypothetical protein JWQ98_1333 [Chlorobi bacterium]|nr:hypothetical protein [Chlorobiota bacterium]
MNRSLPRLIIALALLASAPLLAQDLPPLDLNPVPVYGKRVVTLPKARKGEVIDTSLYQLPPNDVMLFGDRVSNLGGSGGSLPGYREYEAPLKTSYEASLGSYLSPRAMVNAEYIRKRFDVAGDLDYRGTAGHIDSAKASSLLIGARGSLLIGDGIEPLRGLRLAGGFQHLGDGYFLYGNARTRFDRSRTGNSGNVMLKSEEELPFSYRLAFQLDGMSVVDTDVDTVREATSTSPTLMVGLAGRIDSSWGFNGGMEFSSTSLRYTAATNTPTFLSFHGDAEWRPSRSLFLTGGIVVANGDNSDSGSSSLIMPRLSLRYEASRALSLFGWFAPELRAATYRDRIMAAPYVDRDIVLRPERVPVRLAAGGRLSLESITLEGRVFFESAGNTPIVTASGLPGELHYDYIASRTIGAMAAARLLITPTLTLDADAVIRSAVDSLNRAMPMIPAVDLRARADFALNREIDLFGSLLVQTEERTVLSDSAATTGELRLPMRFLLGAGGSYRLLEHLSVFAEITNLLANQYELWQNYSVPRFEIRGGVKGTF